jgi:hypothetical protein
VTTSGLTYPLVALLATAAFGVACGSSNSTPPPQTAQPYAGYPTGQQPGTYPGTQPGAYPPPGAQPGAAPGAYPPPAQPGYPPQPGAAPPPGAAPAPSGGGFPGIPGFPPPSGGGGGSAGGTAQPLDPNLAGLATGPLTMLANSQAPGMAKDGPTVAGNFSPGQTLTSQFTFQPGKCYTLIGQGVGVSITLEIQYVTPLPGLAPSVGKSSAGSQATLGAGANCLRPLSPFPANAMFIVTAASGQGLAAAQLYSK